jgi:hypothetical protein
MSAPTLLPLHAAPQLHIYDPSGHSIPHHDIPKPITSKTNKEESPPMFKVADRLAIVCGDDYYHLPKEMDFSHWEGDLGDLYNFKELPFCHWPDKVSLRFLSFPRQGLLSDI